MSGKDIEFVNLSPSVRLIITSTLILSVFCFGVVLGVGLGYPKWPTINVYQPAPKVSVPHTLKIPLMPPRKKQKTQKAPKT